MNRETRTYLLLIAASAVLSLLTAACASIGRPEGGPRDEEPPVFVKSSPMPGKLGFDGKRIDIYFNENVQVEDAFNKVIVSPVQITPPQISANGKHLRVELRDTLIPNTTYTIDFADAVKDLNEGNVLDGFAYDFSTGETIDSLRISGMVLAANNLEPAQGMLVGAYTNLEDSAITTLPMERIAKTDQYGRFTIRGLKEGKYRLFAVNDVNRDYKWDRSEDVAFFDDVVSPYVEHIIVNDTLRAGDGVSDSIVARAGVRYLPNDVLLTWFNEGYSAQYLKDYKRPDRRRLTVNFATQNNLDSLPVLTIAKGKHEGLDAKEWAKLNANATGDTLEYWISDPEVLATDSLLIAMRYQRTDTLEQLTWTTDTLKFFFRDKVDKKKKKESGNQPNDSVPKLEFLNVNFPAGSTQDVYLPLRMQLSQPIDTIDEAAYRLEMQQDTMWIAVDDVHFAPDSLKPLLYRNMDVKWQPGAKYRLTIDSCAVQGIYKEWNKPVKHEFTVRAIEEYANLVLRITPISNGAFVELLNSNDVALVVRPVVDGKATFPLVAPGEYYVRAFIDANGNGKWDTGVLSDSTHVQPEEVYYMPKKLNLRKNWDVEQVWNIYETPLDMQKPYAILKNKPKLKNGEKDDRDIENLEDETDPWGNNGFDQYGNPVDDRRRNNTSRNRSYNSRGMSSNSDAMRRR